MWVKESAAAFGKTVYLSSPTMHAEEREYVRLAFDTNWVSCLGENVDEIERLARERVGCAASLALCSGTAALHLAMKLAAEKAYGPPARGRLFMWNTNSRLKA